MAVPSFAAPGKVTGGVTGMRASQFNAAVDAVDALYQYLFGDVINIHGEDYQAAGDGTTDDTAKFTSAAAQGKPIMLRDQTTYLVSGGIDAVTGTRIICPFGEATILLKTGSGGFNIKDVGGTRTDLDRCFFSCDGVDKVGMEGVRFKTDGVADVVIYPIRTSGGLGSIGADFRRLRFEGLAVGEMIGINSAGEGGYRVVDVAGLDCGTAQGSSYWTGTPQWTLFALDNDVVGGVYSEPGFGALLKVKDCLFTGTALADFGQETDCFNHIGMNSDRRGPTIIGIDANGIGEVVDIFGSHTTVKGINAINAHIYVAKLIHGARHCHIEIDSVKSCAHVLGLWGSSSSSEDTEHNTVEIGTVEGVGEVGGVSEPAVVTIGGAALTRKPKSNIVRVGRVISNVTSVGNAMEYVIRDGGADNSLGNLISVDSAEGWGTQFCDAPPGNVKVRYKDQREIRATVGTSQNLANGTPTTVEYNTAAQDDLSEINTGTFTIRPKIPGRKFVHAVVRVNPDAAGDTLELAILKNGAVVAGPIIQVFHSATGGQVHEISKIIYIDEDEAGKSASDLTIRATATHGGTFTVVNTALASFFEVVDV